MTLYCLWRRRNSGHSSGQSSKRCQCSHRQRFCQCALAKELDADVLIILTAIEKAAIHFGTPEQTWLDDITVAEAKQYIAEGHFAPGSMLPKMQAAVEFAESAPGRQSLITLLEKAREGIQGLTGTRIHLE